MSGFNLYETLKTRKLLDSGPSNIMSEHTELSLKHFYIYNDSYGQKEGEEEQKIMFYFPSKTNIDEKMKNVGLSEAIIQFTEMFSKTECESLHTEKSRHYYYKPEPNFCMVMTVNVPVQSSIEGKTFHGEEVQDSVCRAVVKQAYVMYRLFNNTFTSLLDANKRDPAQLKVRLEAFFTQYLSKVRLQQCDVMDVFQGVQFLPLDKQTFLHIQCFVNLLEASFAEIEFTAFLHNDRLIWSGLGPEDMQVVFHYLVTELLPKSAPQPTSDSALQITPLTSYGRFVTGPENVHSSTNNVGKVPKLILSSASYQLVVYRASSCTVCLFIPESEQLTMEMFRKWETFLGPRLSTLVEEVVTFTTRARPASSTAPADSVTRFLYYNHMNLATKSTVHAGRQTTVSPQVLNIVSHMCDQHQRSVKAGNSSAETIVKTTSDYWVVGKLSNARQFFVIIQHKNANLIEINDEVNRICENELKSIFFQV